MGCMRVTARSRLTLFRFGKVPELQKVPRARYMAPLVTNWDGCGILGDGT
jgi:hypothetical protein